MTKKIAVINDLSGFGRCSLTAAISVISVMGIQPCPLPTAILSAQTGYKSYYCDDYTDKMEFFRREWEQMGAHFDGIYTGFVSSERQIEQIHRFLDTFYKESAFLLVDPVMGDNGTTYDMYTQSLCVKMRELARRADVITPNLTELCLLADVPFEAVAAVTDTASLLDRIKQIGTGLLQDGPNNIIVTGITHTDINGNQMIGNLYLSPTSCNVFSFPCIGGSYSGTGDLFASCVAAGLARGDKLPDIIALFGKFLVASLKDTVAENIPRNDGINYERYLPLLTPENNF